MPSLAGIDPMGKTTPEPAPSGTLKTRTAIAPVAMTLLFPMMNLSDAEFSRGGIVGTGICQVALWEQNSVTTPFPSRIVLVVTPSL